MNFTEEHVWLREEDDEVIVGITSYAAELLGDLVFVELPSEGTTISKDEEVVVIEGADDANDILAPLDGEVVEVNEALTDRPAMVNDDPQGNGWLFKMVASDLEPLADYMDEAGYAKFIR